MNSFQHIYYFIGVRKNFSPISKLIITRFQDKSPQKKVLTVSFFPHVLAMPMVLKHDTIPLCPFHSLQDLKTPY